MVSSSRVGRRFVVCSLVAMSAIAIRAQNPTQPLDQTPALQRDPLRPAPNRASGEGFGPYKTMVVRGAMLIDGTGGPPRGPVDIVVEDNRITAIRNAGTPGMPMRPNRPPKADYEIDATGMYVMPGFVDLHVHAGGAPKNADAEYAYKLWLAHGVTTVRGVPLDRQRAGGQGEGTQREERDRRAAHLQLPASGRGLGQGHSADAGSRRARGSNWAHANGIDGLKLGSERPELMEIYCSTKRRSWAWARPRTSQQTGVVQMNAIKAARLGLGTVTHFYGHFESLLKDYVVQPYPVTQNYNNEQDRFGQVARLWDKIHPPGSPEWKAYLEEHLKLGTTFDPTLTIYSAGRDVMRFRAAEWHDKFTLPSLMEFYTPDRAQPRRLLVRLDHRGRSRVPQLLPGVVQADERLQEDGRPRHDRIRLGLHLSDLRLRLHQRARAAAGSRLPSARSDPVGDDERRGDAATSRCTARRRSASSARACSPTW